MSAASFLFIGGSRDGCTVSLEVNADGSPNRSTVQTCGFGNGKAIREIYEARRFCEDGVSYFVFVVSDFNGSIFARMIQHYRSVT